MERPSHIIFATQSRSHRLPLIGLAVSLQALVVWLFVHGLVSGTFHLPPGPIVLTPFDDPPKPGTKPPEPKLITVPKPTAVDPLNKVTIAPPGDGGITAILPPPDTGPSLSKSVGETHAPVSITTTHTVPPYPPIARRLGAEGKVTLNLTVNADGRVAQAEIVTSSGSGELDQAAQQWIVAHWKYKPALADGAPAVSHTLATVTFNLINER